MTPHAARPPRRPVAIGVWLALCLLFSQWLGYAHAIAHAGVQTEIESVSAAQGDSFGHAKSASSCAALDAVALGAGLPMALPAPLPPAMPDARPVQALRAGWHQLVSVYFSSRAPPVNA